ncbi:protein MGARP [Mantella aurantiaca]
MLVCRSAWQRLAPLTQRATSTLLRNAPVRHMSASSVPGSTGEALPYYLFVGVAFIGAGTYAYRTVTRDRARFQDRHEFFEQLKPQVESVKVEMHDLNSNGLKGVMVETTEGSGTTEEAVEAAIEEVSAEVVTDQEAVPAVSREEEVIEQEVVTTISLEQEQPVTEEEASPSPADEPAVKAEVSTEQVEQENTEPVVESVAAEISPVLEAISDSIPEELASAAEDWSELSARKPEESAEENFPAAQESEEVVESEAAASS